MWVSFILHTAMSRDYHTVRTLAEKYGIPPGKMQDIAKTLGIKKNTANIYYFDKEDIRKFKRFLRITEYLKPITKRQKRNDRKIRRQLTFVEE